MDLDVLGSNWLMAKKERSVKPVCPLTSLDQSHQTIRKNSRSLFTFMVELLTKVLVSLNIYKHHVTRILLTWSARMHNTASMVAWSESPFIGVSFNYR